ncbi:hypothetical protein I317_01717 [Kwoniella heveanensis CBS 569]|nr:hypothetical protein I317_01717 [Kwoniella heveanensis CBS 569]
MQLSATLLFLSALTCLALVQALPPLQPRNPTDFDQLAFHDPCAPVHIDDSALTENFKGICPNLDVRCVKDGDWTHPIGKLGPKRRLVDQVRFAIPLRAIPRRKAV